MKINWGWKIGILYGGFVILIVTLVVASSRQHFDLVSKDYYEAELGYQKVIDAGKNQSALSQPLAIHANENAVTIDFPEEFKSKNLSGEVQFYSPVNADWDRNFKLDPKDNSVTISRSTLRNTKYTIKISCKVDGKAYYQASEIMLRS